MITRMKTALAGLVLALTVPTVSNAATITDNDAFLELGSVIDTFATASLTAVPSPTGITTSIVGQNLLAGTSFAASDNSGAFSIVYSALPPLAGTELDSFSDAGVVEILFESAAPSPLAPGGLFLLEFVYVPFTAPLPGAPLLGSATLYQVSQIPLPAGLPLVITAFGGLWLVRRSKSLGSNGA